MKEDRSGGLHGQSILIVSVANIGTDVLGVWTTVDQTVGVVDITILWVDTQSHRVRGVSEIEEDHSSLRSRSSGPGSNRDTVVLLLVNDHVVRGTSGEVTEVTGEIDLVGECDGLGGIDGQQLRHVEDLDAVTGQLGTDEHVVLVGANLVPDTVVSDRRE